MFVLNNKISLYSVAFLLSVSIVYLNNYELTFLVWFLIFVFTITQKYSIEIIKHILFFSLILVTAFIVCLFRNESIYNIFRDVAYLLKPILGFLIKNIQNIFLK
jgi:hypothetical protein